MAVHIMASQHNNNNATRSKQQQQQEEELSKPMFHDFLGMKSATAADDSHAVVLSTSKTNPPSESVGASSGGACGPISTVSDLGSERQVNHLEGIPFYGHRDDNCGPEVSNRLAGTKRSNSDSSFMGSARDRVPQMASNSLVNSHLMKIIRDGAGVETPRRSNDDEAFFGVQPLRQSSASLVIQPPSGSRVDASRSKWGQSSSIKELTAMQYHPYGGQFNPFMHQTPPKRFKDAAAGPSIISQSAADEGSRTGKGPGVLSSLNASGSVSDRNTMGALPSSSRLKTGTQVLDLESSVPPGRQGITSASRQMTIFYGGQAHVFDDVHPNKADIIMSLAGSNGGSWSITYSQLSSAKPSGENETGTPNAYTREPGGRLSMTGNTTLQIGSSDGVSAPSGVHQGNAISTDTRNPGRPAERSNGDKREI